MASDPQVEYSGRSPMRSLMGIQILGTGSYVPENIVKNEDLSSLGCDPGWIVQRTGIKERRHAPPEIATSDMAYEAALKALDDAGVSKDEIDLIIVGTFTPDSATPSTACRLQDKLGIKCAAMDLSAACAGFMYTLVTASQFVACGTSKRALVVGVDLLSRVINPNDKRIYPLFGDGAGAVVLGPGTQDQGFVSYTLGSEGEGGDLLCIPAGGTREPITAEALAANRQYLHMDGRSVFKWAVRLISDSVTDVMKHAQVTPDDLTLLLLHQANVRIIDAACDNLGFDRNKIPVNLDVYGNTSAGSVPIVLDEIRKKQPIQLGDQIALCGFGAGLAWGSAIFRW